MSVDGVADHCRSRCPKQHVGGIGGRTLTGYQYDWRPHLITPYR